jgi:hypothetical protein
MYESPSSQPSLGQAGPSQSKVTPKSTLDVNSLNFCRFSLSTLPDFPNEAYLATPNLTSSETIDIYHLPSCKRLHSSIGYIPTVKADAGRGGGIIMSIHLGFHKGKAVLVVGFEDGRVEVWSCEKEELKMVWDGRVGQDVVWNKLWEGKKHNEAGLLSFSCSWIYLAEKKDSHGNGCGSRFETHLYGISRPSACPI